MAEQKWFEGLRRQIKHRCGPGWGIDERHGGVRLTRRIAAGKQHKNPRQTVQLGIPWNPAHSGDIFLVVCQIRERMENGEESLANAFELQQKKHGSTPTVSKSVDDEESGWKAVIDDFIERRRQNNRATGRAPEKEVQAMGTHLAERDGVGTRSWLTSDCFAAAQALHRREP